MPINVNTTPEQIGVTVGETQIDVAVGGGVGPTGNTGVVNVSAPITNTGTTTAANIGLSVGTGLEVFAGALAVSFGSSAFQVCRGDDARLSNSREWSASTVTQAEAEAGTSTTRRAFTPLRVFQAIAAWWAASSAKTKLDGIATGATANATDAQLRDRSTHTGTQLAVTISDFASAVVAAAPPTTNASLLTSGTLPDARLSSNIARTSDVSSAVAAVVNAAPAALDTLKELADALGSDANFSTTVTNALAAKAPLASPTFTGTVSGITATMVGLGNVDNTSDANKPISTATQTALDGKAAASHTHTASAITDFTAAVVAAAPPTVDASLLTTGTLSASRLPSTSVTPGSYGSASSVATYTVDGTGRLTAAGSTSIAIAAGAVSGLASVATAGTFASLSSKPTTLSGYGITDAVASNDARLSDSRAPTGAAGGDLTGTYPNPQIAAGAVVTADLADSAVTTAKIANAAVTIAKVSATGTASATTFLRGDGAWATAGSNSASDLTTGTLAAARIGAHASSHQTGGSDAVTNVVVSPSQITGNQNDYSPGTGDIVRLSSDAARNITGITAGSSGEVRVLVNVGSFTITLVHQSTSSTAANRFLVSFGADYLLAANAAAVIVYDATTSRWRVI